MKHFESMHESNGVMSRRIGSALAYAFLFFVLSAATPGQIVAHHSETGETIQEHCPVVKDKAIRPFCINVPESALVDLRQRRVGAAATLSEELRAAFRSLR